MVLWLIPLDGGSPRELLKINSRSVVGVGGGLGWTPDGRFVLFMRLGRSERGLWYVSTSGGEARKLAVTGMDASKVYRFYVHPDGKQLALRAVSSSKSEVWALENFLPPLADAKPAAATDASAAKSP
jgi:Tol biopolymer transport system component